MSVSVNDKGAVADGRLLMDAHTSGGSKDVWCPTYNFVSADIGKWIHVDGAFNDSVLSGLIESVNGGIATLNVTANRTKATPAIFGKNNTVQIQAAIDDGVGETVQFGKGMYLHGPLNVTHRAGTVLQGSGGAYGGTRLIPCAEDSVGIDCSGSGAVQIRNMMIGEHYNPCVPKVAILHAPTTQVPGLDFILHENLLVTGRYYVAPFYNFGAGTSRASKCAYWNFAPVSWQGERYAAVFSLDNSQGAVSPFATLMPTGYSAEWALDACEFHEYSGGPDFGAILLRGASDLVFSGGVVSGSGKLIVCKDPTGMNPPRRIVAMAVRFESEQGTPQPSHVINAMSNIERGLFLGCMAGTVGGAIKTGPGSTPGCAWDGVPF